MFCDDPATEHHQVLALRNSAIELVQDESEGITYTIQDAANASLPIGCKISKLNLISASTQYGAGASQRGGRVTKSFAVQIPCLLKQL